MTLNLPLCPASLKVIQPYLKIADEHELRDPVIAYWCRLYALQSALKVDKKSDDAKLLLISLMDWLEAQKKRYSENEAITNDIAACAHIENYALKLFTWADKEDRAAVFNKNVVKAFYTAGILLDTLETFGEVDESLVKSNKYAKWKAAHIHTCLKNGTTPIAGPFSETRDDGLDDENQFGSGLGFENVTGDPHRHVPSDDPTTNFPTPGDNTFSNDVSFTAKNKAVTPTSDNENKMPYNTAETTSNFVPAPSKQAASSAPSGNGGPLDPTLISKAQKYCKFAGSALNYDDVSEAINYLNKALKLLQTGQDS